MTLQELEKKLLTINFSYKIHDLFLEQIDGLFMKKERKWWAFYYCERGHNNLESLFFTEDDACEYFFCHYKKVFDENRWFGNLMRQYPQDLIKKMKRFKVPEWEYSFGGGMPENFLCVAQKEMIDNGEISHQILKHEDGVALYDICSDYFEQNGGKTKVWEVYYSDGIKKLNHGIFFGREDAYDFLFYLVMKKYVNIKKRWW